MRDDTDPIERRLQAWGAWLRGGASGDGYPTKSVLHVSWLPPAPGQLPTLRTSTRSDRQERETDRAVRALGLRLQNTLAVVYVMRAPVAEQAALLECQPSTVHARVAEAKRAMRAA